MLKRVPPVRSCDDSPGPVRPMRPGKSGRMRHGPSALRAVPFALWAAACVNFEIPSGQLRCSPDAIPACPTGFRCEVRIESDGPRCFSGVAAKAPDKPNPLEPGAEPPTTTTTFPVNPTNGNSGPTLVGSAGTPGAVIGANLVSSAGGTGGSGGQPSLGGGGTAPEKPRPPEPSTGGTGGAGTGGAGGSDPDITPADAGNPLGPILWKRAPDASVDAGSDAGDAGDAGAATDAGDASSSPLPTDPCHRCDTQRPRELALGSATLNLDGLSEHLVFWLDPSSLPDIGQPVTCWCDRSGNGHHARGVVTPADPPISVVAPATLPGLASEFQKQADLRKAYLKIPADPAMALGEDDFMILVGGRRAGGNSVPLYVQKLSTDAQFFLRIRETSPEMAELQFNSSNTAQQVELRYGPALNSNRARLFGAARTGEELHLLSGDQSCAGTSLVSGQALEPIRGDVLTGALMDPDDTPPVRGGGVFLMAQFKGKLDPAQIQRIQDFSCTALGICPDAFACP
jgi:hypothetical protein